MMSIGFADKLRQRQGHGLRHNQAMGDLQVGAHFRREDLHIAHQRFALRQRAADEGHQLRQRFPLRLPAAQRPLMLLDLPGIQRRHQPRRTLGGGQNSGAGDGIAFVRHGGRPAAPFSDRLRHFRHFGLHQQRKIIGEFTQRAADPRVPRSHLQQPVTLTVPGCVRQLQVEGFRQRDGDLRRLGFKGVQGTRRAAKLQGQHPRAHFPQARLPAQQRIQRPGKLKAKGHR